MRENDPCVACFWGFWGFGGGEVGVWGFFGGRKVEFFILMTACDGIWVRVGVQ